MIKSYDSIISGRIPKDLMDQVKETGLSNTEIITKALTYYFENTVSIAEDDCIQTNFDKLSKDIDIFLQRYYGVPAEDLEES